MLYNKFKFTNSFGDRLLAEVTHNGCYEITNPETGSVRCTVDTYELEGLLTRGTWYNVEEIKEEKSVNTLPSMFEIINPDVGNVWKCVKNHNGSYTLTDEDGAGLYDYKAEDIQKWIDQKVYKIVEPAVQAVDLFLELHAAIYAYGLRYVQDYEDGVMHYTIRYGTNEYHAKDEAGVRQIIGLIGQLEQFV